jgi:SAM-dependent methyltransferase
MLLEQLPRLYTEFAGWYRLLTPPEEYAEEAACYQQALSAAISPPPVTLLELGCGGGHLASHYKRHFRSTLVDLSPQMLALSQSLNSECEHHLGDMCTLRLGRLFDAVLIHDAIMYLTTLDELQQAMRTAFVHLRPGGAALFVPDDVQESFVEDTDHGGSDGAGRALRYLAWSWDPDPEDTTYFVDYAYLLHEDGQPLRCVQDRHVEGLFSRADWLRLLAEVGFTVTVVPRELSDAPRCFAEMFIALRPAE